MERINVYAYEDDGYGEGSSALAGWFDYDKAEVFWENTEWDGSNRISVITGSQWDHEALLRTSGGRWVIRAHSNRQGVMDSYRFISDSEAREWLIRNHDDSVIARFFGEIEEERGPGRPPIGEDIHAKMPADLVAMVDAYAAEHGIARAEAIRRLLTEALNVARPYTVTIRDISTGVREIQSRHATLGAAVEALRAEQEDDAEDNGLPSWQPRVEHDGRPVDVEAMQ